MIEMDSVEKKIKNRKLRILMPLGTRSVLNHPHIRSVPAAMSIIAQYSPARLDVGSFLSRPCCTLNAFPLQSGLEARSSVPLDRTVLRHFGPRWRLQVPDQHAQRAHKLS